MSRVASGAASLALAVALPLLLFGWVEGCSSTWIAVRAALDRNEGPALRRHDDRLGWVSLPSLAQQDLWGPGRHLHTNERGFRGRLPVSDTVPGGRVRVVCSGDSFAFGEGVGDEQTFCHALTRLDPRVEAVNLGQPGYGVDQAYLRYRGLPDGFEHQVHLFTFIGPDLSRAGSDDFHGFAKPVFTLDGDALALRGVPVPERGPALRRAAGAFLGDLRVTEFVHRARKKLFGRPPREGDAIFERLGPMLDRLFQEVAREGQRRGARTLFVYLPLRSEVEADGRWRAWVRESFEGSGLPFLDLTAALRAEPAETAHGYFIPEGAAAAGHYSPRGNAWAGREIHAALDEAPVRSN
ncbi:MAG: hypothetical protein ACQGVC_05500 [Myxococcota bacterium]